MFKNTFNVNRYVFELQYFLNIKGTVNKINNFFNNLI